MTKHPIAATCASLLLGAAAVARFPDRLDARLQQLADRNIRRYGLLDGTEATR